MGIGEKLKEARQQTGLTLNDVQEMTKIQKRYLQAIEEGNFHILPGSFYAKAFIKEYANAVGLNANELLEIYEDELPSIGEKQSGSQYTRLQRTRKTSEPSRITAFFSFLPTVIVILLVIGIIFLAVYFYKQKADEAPVNNDPGETNEYYWKNENENDFEEKSENNEDENETMRETGDHNVSQNNEDEEDEEVEQEFVEVTVGEGNPPESSFDFIHDADEVILTIEAKEDSWLDVDIDDESVYSNFITEESSPLEEDLTDKEVVVLNIGHAPGVDVKINDLLLDYPVDENEYVLQKLIINLKQHE